MRIAITGGRDRTPTAEEMRKFWLIWARLGGTFLAHGAARGTDSFVAEHVYGEGWQVLAFPVLYGKEDGPDPKLAPKRRNRRMLRQSGAEVLVAFPGRGGTADCKAAAEEVGVPVVLVVDEPLP